MANMLDLTVLQEQTFEIKMLDGTTLRLRKPTQRLLLDFIAFEKNTKDITFEKQMDEIKSLTIKILNNNTSGKMFKELDDNYDLAIQQAIIKSYGEFTSDLLSQKN